MFLMTSEMWPLYKSYVSRNALSVARFVYNTTILAASLLHFTEYFIPAHKRKTKT